MDERAAWLRLALTPGIASASARALLREFGLPGVLFSHPPEHGHAARIAGAEAARALLAPPAALTRQCLARAQDWLDADAAHSLVCLADADYPANLLQLADAPLLLYAAGRRELLGRPGIAVVGSRNATRQGERNAADFAGHLGRAGLCIISGLASGIDAAAHKGALDAGADTIALLGTGIDIAYPARHGALAQRIAREGLVLTEYPLGAPPQAHHFPRRNRLIAALARAVLVVEAALRSGSLITARIGAELGREVLAIPGSIHSPLSRGCHRLIREGAKLVESVADVLEELPPAASPLAPAPRAGDGPERGAHPVLAALEHEAVDLDVLALRLGRDPGSVVADLLELELAGLVERLPGNRYQRIC